MLSSQTRWFELILLGTTSKHVFNNMCHTFMKRMVQGEPPTCTIHSFIFMKWPGDGGAAFGKSCKFLVFQDEYFTVIFSKESSLLYVFKTNGSSRPTTIFIVRLQPSAIIWCTLYAASTALAKWEFRVSMRYWPIENLLEALRVNQNHWNYFVSCRAPILSRMVYTRGTATATSPRSPDSGWFEDMKDETPLRFVG